MPPRPEVFAFSPGVHGGTNAGELAEFGRSESDTVDFSASVSPFGPSPRVLEAISAVPLDAYPDPEAPLLRQAIAAQNQVELDQVIVTNGSVELIQLVALAYLAPGRRLLSISPAFGEYEPMARVMGARAEFFPLEPAVGSATGPIHAPGHSGFRLDHAAFLDWVERRLPAVVVVNDPHNPTGVTFGESLITQLLDLSGEVLVVVDEAYREFMEYPADLCGHLDSGRLVLMRSLTKAYALAGIRLGYGISSSEVIKSLSRVRPPWTVNSLAQAAGIAALSDQRHLSESMAQIRVEKEFLTEGLRGLGFPVVPSAANFFLVEVPDSWGVAARAAEGATASSVNGRVTLPDDAVSRPAVRSTLDRAATPADGLTAATLLRRYLLSRGIRLRSCESFGLPRYLRLAPRSRPDNERLLADLREVQRQGRSRAESIPLHPAPGPGASLPSALHTSRP